MNPEYAKLLLCKKHWQHDVVGHVPKEILNYGGLHEWVKGCKVREVSNSKKWTGNPNNDGREKAQSFTGCVQQNERTLLEYYAEPDWASLFSENTEHQENQ